MTISPISAATTVCEEMNWSIADMQLEKILYMANLIFMGRNKGNPLLTENFCAWAGGPYIISLRDRNRVFGARSIDYLPPVKRNMNLPEQQVTKLVSIHLKSASPAQLVSMTHRIGGGWNNAWKHGCEYIPISSKAIMEEYQLYHKTN